MKAAKKFAFDVSLVFAGSMLSLTLNFFKKPVMARYLGPEGLGLFEMVTMITNIITLITELGVSSALVKYVAEHKEDKNKISALVLSSIITVTALGILASVTLFSLSDTFARLFDMPALSFLIKIYSFVPPFSLIFSSVLALFNGLREMKYHTFFNILNNVLIFIFILSLLMLGFGITGALIGDMLAIIVVVAVAIYAMRKYIIFRMENFKENIKMLASFGSRLMGVGSINVIHSQADSILIGYFLTAGELGHYTAAVSLSRFFWRVPDAIRMVTYPAASEYWSKKKIESLSTMIDKSIKYSSCILLFAGIAVMFFANDAIILLFGEKFEHAALPLQILLIGTVIYGGISRPILGALIGAGHPGLSLTVTVVSAIANVTMNVILIPSLGIVGAAISTSASLLLATALHIYFVIRTLHVNVDFKWLSKAFSIYFISISTFNFYPHIYALGFVILCVVLLLIIKYLLTKEDRDLLKSLLR